MCLYFMNLIFFLQKKVRHSLILAYFYYTQKMVGNKIHRTISTKKNVLKSGILAPNIDPSR